jgi:hypothetical protein
MGNEIDCSKAAAERDQICVFHIECTPSLATRDGQAEALLMAPHAADARRAHPKSEKAGVPPIRDAGSALDLAATNTAILRFHQNRPSLQPAEYRGLKSTPFAGWRQPNNWLGFSDNSETAALSLQRSTQQKSSRHGESFRCSRGRPSGGLCNNRPYFFAG